MSVICIIGNNNLSYSLGVADTSLRTKLYLSYGHRLQLSETNLRRKVLVVSITTPLVLMPSLHVKYIAISKFVQPSSEIILF